MKRFVHLFLGPLVFLLLPGASGSLKSKEAPVKRITVSRSDVRIEVLAQGAGPTIVILPSRGRGAEDYDQVAALLAAEGFRILRPQPRGIGASKGPMSGITLHDYAADVAAVIEKESKGPALVVGHAFGNYVARMLATDRPDLVRGLVLAAGSAGKLPPGTGGPVISNEMREAVDKSGDLSLPDEERLRFIQMAFFAPGHDARVWLHGWYPEALQAEGVAETKPSPDVWFAGGKARILDLQAEEDAVAPRKFAGIVKGELGDRVTVVVIPNAGHALAPEQPEAMAKAIAEFARSL